MDFPRHRLLRLRADHALYRAEAEGNVSLLNRPDTALKPSLAATLSKKMSVKKNVLTNGSTLPGLLLQVLLLSTGNH